MRYIQCECGKKHPASDGSVCCSRCSQCGSLVGERSIDDDGLCYKCRNDMPNHDCMVSKF